MDTMEALRVLSTITVAFIVLVLHYVYKKRFRKKLANTRVNILGVLIVTISILLAYIWMWKF